MKLNKYSDVITEFNDTTGGRHYIFYKGELAAFGKDNTFYVENRRKKSVIEFIENTYAYKYKGAEITECYSLNNMLA